MPHRNPIDIPGAPAAPVASYSTSVPLLQAFSSPHRRSPSTRRASSSGNWSWPAGTGVWVVKTHCSRTFSISSAEIGSCLVLRGEFLFHQRKDEQGGMPLIHVEPRISCVSERPQEAKSAEPQHHFLTQAIMVVASIEHIREGPVPRLFSLTSVSSRYTGTTCPDSPVTRYLQALTWTVRPSISTVARSSNSSAKSLTGQATGSSTLPALRIQSLKKVPTPVQQGHRHHRHIEIRSRANRVAGEHTEPSRIGRHPGLKADLHGKIGDARSVASSMAPLCDITRRTMDTGCGRTMSHTGS